MNRTWIRDVASDSLLIVGIALMLFLAVYGNVIFMSSPAQSVNQEMVETEQDRRYGGQLEMQGVFERYGRLFYYFSFFLQWSEFFCDCSYMDEPPSTRAGDLPGVRI